MPITSPHPFFWIHAALRLPREASRYYHVTNSPMLIGRCAYAGDIVDFQRRTRMVVIANDLIVTTQSNMSDLKKKHRATVIFVGGHSNDP